MPVKIAHWRDRVSTLPKWMGESKVQDFIPYKFFQVVVVRERSNNLKQ